MAELFIALGASLASTTAATAGTAAAATAASAATGAVAAGSVGTFTAATAGATAASSAFSLGSVLSAVSAVATAGSALFAIARGNANAAAIDIQREGLELQATTLEMDALRNKTEAAQEGAAAAQEAASSATRRADLAAEYRRITAEQSALFSTSGLAPGSGSQVAMTDAARADVERRMTIERAGGRSAEGARLTRADLTGINTGLIRENARYTRRRSRSLMDAARGSRLDGYLDAGRRVIEAVELVA
jgi:hypothetical protein